MASSSETSTSTSTPLLDLAHRILASAQTLTTYLETTTHPQPTFHPSSPPTLLPPNTPPSILTAHHTLLATTHTLHTLALGPRDHLRWYGPRQVQPLALQHATVHHLASHIPLPTPTTPHPSISYTHLLASLHPSHPTLSLPTLKRVLRLLATAHIFAEPFPGHVAHTAASALLATDPVAADATAFMVQDCFPAAARAVEAAARWGDEGGPGESGFGLAFGTGGRDYFAYWAEEAPERAERFGVVLRDMGAAAGYEAGWVGEGFGWEGVGEGRVVDVGGSQGHVSIELAKRFPKLEFVVQDRLDVIEVARREVVPTLAEDVGKRVRFEVNDFFEAQPVTDADVYLLRFILHDWPDKYAEKIVQQLIPGMEKGARMFVMDAILPEVGTLPWVEEYKTRHVDLIMMLLSNAKERELDDWKALFSRVDGRLKVRGVVTPVGSILSAMEVVLEQ